MADKTQRACIAVKGELTIYTVTELKDKFLGGLLMNDELELNLSEVSEIDGAGLQLLVMAKQSATALEKTLFIIGHSPVVAELIDLSGLSGFFGDPLLMAHQSKLEGESL
jgi:anti-anti-sigma factor